MCDNVGNINRSTGPADSSDFKETEKMSKICPNCGACQECGRGGHQLAPNYPFYPTYPYWPFIWYGTGDYVTTTSTGVQTSGYFQETNQVDYDQLNQFAQDWTKDNSNTQT